MLGEQRKSIQDAATDANNQKQTLVLQQSDELRHHRYVGPATI